MQNFYPSDLQFQIVSNPVTQKEHAEILFSTAHGQGHFIFSKKMLAELIECLKLLNAELKE